MHETLAADTVIQAHKGERVDIGPGRADGSTTAIVAGGSHGGGGTPYVIPVTLMLDNKVLARVTRRGMMEEASGMM
jgi:hypothetical protein